MGAWLSRDGGHRCLPSGTISTLQPEHVSAVQTEVDCLLRAMLLLRRMDRHQEMAKQCDCHIAFAPIDITLPRPRKRQRRHPPASPESGCGPEGGLAAPAAPGPDPAVVSPRAMSPAMSGDLAPQSIVRPVGISGGASSPVTSVAPLYNSQLP